MSALRAAFVLGTGRDVDVLVPLIETCRGRLDIRPAPCLIGPEARSTTPSEQDSAPAAVTINHPAMSTLKLPTQSMTALAGMVEALDRHLNLNAYDCVVAQGYDFSGVAAALMSLSLPLPLIHLHPEVAHERLLSPTEELCQDLILKHAAVHCVPDRTMALQLISRGAIAHTVHPLRERAAAADPHRAAERVLDLIVARAWADPMTVRRAA